MKVIPRHLAARIKQALGVSRVVNIVGPRQSGKTTLVKELISADRYITLDDDGVRASIETSPYEQLQLLSQSARKSKRPIVFDEIQRLPEITLALKQIVDENRQPGQFILTGSSDIFTSGKAYDSLAGRVMTLMLRPLSTAEIVKHEPCRLLDCVSEFSQDCLHSLPNPVPFTRTQVIDLVVRGGFPEIRKLNDADRCQRYMSYMDSIIERDVATIAEVRKPDVLRRLIDQLAARTAEELNITALCKVLAARKETVNDYIDILSRLGIVQRLGAWTSSGGGREVKSAKLHFLDTGCVATLRGEDNSSFGIGANPAALGHLLESFVFIELEKSLPYLTKRWRLYHWRQNARELDIIAEAPSRQLAVFEVKASGTVGAEDFRHIDWFLKEGPGKNYKCVGFVVYLGKDLLTFGPGKIALPISMFWSFIQ